MVNFKRNLGQILDEINNYTQDQDEAFYLTAILNSTTPNMMMKDFQSKGLFGARDVHKKILDIYYPIYNSNDETHIQLSELSKKAHKSVSIFLKGVDSDKNLEGVLLGKIRLEIKKYLSNEMKAIDKLVKQIIG